MRLKNILTLVFVLMAGLAFGQIHRVKEVRVKKQIKLKRMVIDSFSVDHTFSNATDTQASSSLAIKTWVEGKLVGLPSQNVFTDDGVLVSNRTVSATDKTFSVTHADGAKVGTFTLTPDSYILTLSNAGNISTIDLQRDQLELKSLVSGTVQGATLNLNEDGSTWRASNETGTQQSRIGLDPGYIDLNFTGASELRIDGASAPDGHLVTSGGPGNAAKWTDPATLGGGGGGGLISALANTTSVDLVETTGILTATVTSVEDATVTDQNNLLGGGVVSVPLQNLINFYNAATFSRWSEGSGNVYRITGNVGIGTNTPLKNLHVEGHQLISESITIGSDLSGFVDFGLTVNSSNGGILLNRTSGDAFIRMSNNSLDGAQINTNSVIAGEAGLVYREFNGAPYSIQTKNVNRFFGNIETRKGNGGSGGANIQQRLSFLGGNLNLPGQYTQAIKTRHNSGGADNNGIEFWTWQTSDGTTGDPSVFGAIIENGKLGVANADPNEALDVTGNIQYSGAIKPGGDSGTAGYLLASDGGNVNTWVDPATLGGASPWSELSGNVYRSSGSVGVGVTNPLAPLHLSGALTTNSSVLLLNESTSNTSFGFRLNTDIAGLNAKHFDFVGGSSTSDISFSPSSTQLGAMVIKGNSGNVGIGTTTPMSKLHVVGVGSEGVSLNVSNRVRIGTVGEAGGVWFGNTSNLFMGQIGTTDFGFYNNGDYRMQIGNNGNIQMNSYGVSAFTGTPTTFPAFDATGNIIERTAAELLSDIGGMGGGNIFDTDGTLTANRIATFDSKTLNFDYGSGRGIEFNPILGTTTLTTTGNGMNFHSTGTLSLINFKSTATTAGNVNLGLTQDRLRFVNIESGGTIELAMGGTADITLTANDKVEINSDLIIEKSVTETAIVDHGTTTANLNNWAPTSLSENRIATVKVNTASDLTGIASQPIGFVLTVVNTGSSTLTLTPNDSASLAQNRFAIGSNFDLLSGRGVEVRYLTVDPGVNRWVIMN